MARRPRPFFWFAGFLLTLGCLPASVRSQAVDDYLAEVRSDVNLIADHLNPQFARVMGFYSTLGWNDGPGGLDLMLGPHVEFGVALGVDLVKIDTTSFDTSVLSTQTALDIPKRLPLPYPAWHARVGLLKGLDFGVRGTGIPRENRNDVSVFNQGYGFSLRYLAVHGVTYPDVSVQATWDTMKGNASYATTFDQQEPYTDGGTTYQGALAGTTTCEETWRVRSFGLKVMVGKSMGVFHPFASAGFQRYAGTVQTRLSMDVNGTLYDASHIPVGTGLLSDVFVRSAEPPVTQPKFTAGFELGTGFYWTNVFETNGHDYAASTGFRAKI